MNRMEKYKKIEKLLQYDGVCAAVEELVAKAKDKYDLETKCYQDHPMHKKFKFGNMATCLVIHGDLFLEIVCDPESGKMLTFIPLPVDSIYRIETTKGKLLEFQQSKTGPDYQAIARCKVNEEDSHVVNAIRFPPESITHCRVFPNSTIQRILDPDDGETNNNILMGLLDNYPYGSSLLEKSPLFWDERDVDKIAKIMIRTVEKLIKQYDYIK